jgi:hypothetical protein
VRLLARIYHWSPRTVFAMSWREIEFWLADAEI